ncbi:transglycosylase SLT domain-containing protein [Streptococcus halichoeri]|uniref:transglycosylase SLT domain-containing protein n=1 Tax=Streptococcus halichoeri TaxID=254785 RepID=UPI001358DDB7|nr:transglycosylase SLT domain-containing protein [Streptococcus halichoeri]
MFKKEMFKKRYISFGAAAIAVSILAILFTFSSKSVNTDSLSHAKAVKSTKTKQSSANKKTQASQKAVPKEPAKVKTEAKPAAPAATQAAATEAQDTQAPLQEVAAVQTTADQPQAQAYTVAQTSHIVSASNGNTAGAVGRQAAAQMASATGVSQATWEAIIARESNGNPNVANASGASGLFQTMPGWGSTATVQDQVNSAIRAYNAQGLAAWGY